MSVTETTTEATILAAEPPKPKARKPRAKVDPKTKRAVAVVKAERKRGAEKAADRPVPRAVADAVGGAATRTFAMRITTAELDAIHKAAGTRGACRFAREAMRAFAAHDGKAFAKVIKAAKANGGSK